jgi:acyl-CoA synthetase (NDP forming)
MANNKTAVKRILAAVKAAGRTSLTAPEGKEVCDAYGIPVPKEGVATTPAQAPMATRDRLRRRISRICS